MRYRGYFFLAILAAAPACSAGVDGPVEVGIGDARFDEEGVKPPPPLGSQDVDIGISSPSSETPFEVTLSEGGPSAETFVYNQPFVEEVHGLYFSNSEFTNGWILFFSENCLVASPDAKIQFNERNGKTFGHGTLTSCTGVVLDLSKIQITGGGFGGCEVNIDVFECRPIEFSYDGIPGGQIRVGPPPPPPPPIP